MSVTRAYEVLEKGLEGTVRRNEPMARHTTYRIGGPAALFVVVDSVRDLALTLATCRENELEWMVTGKGSNMLVGDWGYSGAIIVLGRDFRKHFFDGAHLRSGAGVVLGHLVQEAFSEGLSGLEFAVGIPGTVGGALAMNAGSRDEWIGNIVQSVSVYDPDEGLIGIRGPEIVWGYRRSGLAARGVIVECTLRVEAGDGERIRRVMEASLRRRRANQPMGAACAGSVFVNPDGDSAGRLIENAGLKGYRIGGAEVSKVHANFIVNTGKASAADVVRLVRHVRTVVNDTYGIELRPEIRFVGAFDEA